MDYSGLCKNISDLDQKIRFAATCDRTTEFELPSILYLSMPHYC
jgi:hypothetical protein